MLLFLQIQVRDLMLRVQSATYTTCSFVPLFTDTACHKLQTSYICICNLFPGREVTPQLGNVLRIPLH